MSSVPSSSTCRFVAELGVHKSTMSEGGEEEREQAEARAPVTICLTMCIIMFWDGATRNKPTSFKAAEGVWS